ncbi:hypothetical protein NUW54_g2209 [Trametes sanguinea]|uniref:Uncharacterized protein n=1 Tax=Trametes sanguinea TaxID=158606 RepID=A0ACC1Q4G2_9APHY|nr:hypothetical protein NUW54_g2209 [Trametes sanguinea]
MDYHSYLQDLRQRSSTPSSSRLSHLELPSPNHSGGLISLQSPSAAPEEFHTPSPRGPRPFTELSLLDTQLTDRGSSSGFGWDVALSTPERSYNSESVSKGEYLKALHRVDLLQRRCQELEKSNVELRTTIRIMMDIREDDSLLDVAQHIDFNPCVKTSTSVRGTTVVQGLQVPTDDIPSPVYDPEKHGKLRFWSADQWHPFSGHGPRSREARKDGVPIFLENEDGSVFTQYRYAELCALIKTLLQTLARHSLAPATWGARTTHAERYIQHEVYKSFPVLANCQGHFRLHALLTLMYPAFARYRLANVKKEQQDEQLEEKMAAPKKSSKRPLMAETTSGHSAKMAKSSEVHRSGTTMASTPIPSPQAAQVSFNSFSVSYTQGANKRRPHQSISQASSATESSLQPNTLVMALPPPPSPLSLPHDAVTGIGRESSTGTRARGGSHDATASATTLRDTTNLTAGGASPGATAADNKEAARSRSICICASGADAVPEKVRLPAAI